MTLKGWLESLPANPADPGGVRLLVFEGVLNSDSEKHVSSEEYGLVFAYLLTLPNTVIQRYDDGAARWIGPVDIVFEALETAANKTAMQQLWEGVRQTAPDVVDELEAGVPMATPLSFVNALRPEVRQKGLLSATLRSETNWR